MNYNQVVRGCADQMLNQFPPMPEMQGGCYDSNVLVSRKNPLQKNLTLNLFYISTSDERTARQRESTVRLVFLSGEFVQLFLNSQNVLVVFYLR
jgi:hypothetical protein